MIVKFLPLLLILGFSLYGYRLARRNTLAELDARSSALSDPVLGAFTARLARAMDVPEIPVRVYEVEPVNGLAAPDGRIFLTRGFVNAYQSGQVSAEEMASVIAHELGHVALGHTRKRMIDFSRQSVLGMALVMILGRLIPVFGASIGMALNTAFSARLSRTDEFAADEFASALLLKAGIGTGGAEIPVCQA